MTNAHKALYSICDENSRNINEREKGNKNYSHNIRYGITHKRRQK